MCPALSYPVLLPSTPHHIFSAFSALLPILFTVMSVLALRVYPLCRRPSSAVTYSHTHNACMAAARKQSTALYSTHQSHFCRSNMPLTALLTLPPPLLPPQLLAPGAFNYLSGENSLSADGTLLSLSSPWGSRYTGAIDGAATSAGVCGENRPTLHCASIHTSCMHWHGVLGRATL